MKQVHRLLPILPVPTRAFKPILFSSLLVSCVSQEPKPIDQPIDQPIVAQTRLPERFDSAKQVSSTEIVIPKNLVWVSYVVRPRAEMRVGPGVEFPVKSNILTEGTSVLLLQRLGVWQKVLTINGDELGWVHRKTLAKMRFNDRALKLKTGTLPRVFTVKNVRRLFDFKSRKPLKVKIPKGRGFLCLGWSKQKALVYLAKTNSVAWVAKGDAQ